MSGNDGLTVRVKTAKRRKVSSTRWLARQLNDPYVRKAKASGLRSRAAFKLIEIDDRFGLLRPGLVVVDLGAAPGGWSQVAAERVASVAGHGRVIAIDVLPLDPIAGVEAVELDFMAPEAPERLSRQLAGRAPDVVLSDMAQPATGHRATDHLRIMALLEAAVAFAGETLAPGGAFVGKVLQGGTEAALLAALKRDFAEVRHVKPKASRSESAELYVLATGFRRGAAA
jgi:23S rRNA (uridine2552-2'-O)-methyltransferase